MAGDGAVFKRGMRQEPRADLSGLEQRLVCFARNIIETDGGGAIAVHPTAIVVVRRRAGTECVCKPRHPISSQSAHMFQAYLRLQVSAPELPRSASAWSETLRFNPSSRLFKASSVTFITCICISARGRVGGVAHRSRRVERNCIEQGALWCAPNA